jgi:hypothetical protein
VDDIVAGLLVQLQQLRQDRYPLVTNYLNFDDQDLFNKMIADAISALENLYVFMNFPQDGFYPNTPPKEE